MVYPYNGILFGNKRNEVLYILIYYSMDETCKHYAKWKKPVMKDHKLYSSIYMNSVEQANG